MPSIAELRRYEEEKAAQPASPMPAPPVVAPPTQTAQQSTVAPIAAQSVLPADEIWKSWLRVREDTEETPTTGWWESPGSYPQEVIQRAAEPRVPAPADIITRQFGYAPEVGTPLAKAIEAQQQKATRTEAYGYKEPEVVEQEVGTTLGNYFKEIINSISRGVSEIIESPPEDSTRFGAVANYLFGYPAVGGDKGQVWRAIVKPLDEPSKYNRRLVGYSKNMWGGQTASTFPGMEGAMFEAASLQNGTLVEDTAALLENSNATDEEIAAQLQQVRERQAQYNESRAQRMRQGESASSSASDAFIDVYTSGPIERMPLAPIFTRTAEGALAFSEQSVAAYNESLGYRYTWDVDEQAGEQYLADREAGMSPIDAATKNENTVIEEIYKFVFDPNWYLGLDNFIIGTGLKAVKGVGRGALAVGNKIPVARRGLTWLSAVNASTLGKRAANSTKTMMHAISAYADETDQVLTPQLIEQIIKTPPPELLKISRQVTEAFSKSADSADNIVKAVNAAFESGLSDEALEAIRKELSHASLTVPEDVIVATATRRAFEDAVNKAASASYAFALDTFVSLEPGLERLIRAKTPIQRLLTNVTSTAKSTLIDLWLGTRPAWNVFNYVDNTVKLMLSGVNPFGSIPDLATTYLNAAPEMGYAVSALRELRKIPFYKMGGANNKRYVELLYSLLPPQAIGGFGKQVVEESTQSLLRKVPGVGAFINWNNSIATRIEASSRARVYFTSLDNYVTKARSAMVDRIAGAMVDGVFHPLSANAANALRQRLNRLGGLPTVEDIERVFRDVITEDGRTIVSTIGEEFGDSLTHLPTESIKRIQASLGQITEAAARLGNRSIPIDEVNKIFNDAAQAILRDYDEMVATATRAVEDSLPTYTERMDDFIARAWEQEISDPNPIHVRQISRELQDDVLSGSTAARKLRELGWSDSQIGKLGTSDAEVIIKHSLTPPVEAVHRFASREADIQRVLNKIRGGWDKAYKESVAEIEETIRLGGLPPGTKVFSSPVEYAEFVVDTVPEVYIDDVAEAFINKMPGYTSTSAWNPVTKTLYAEPESAIVVHEFAHVAETTVREHFGDEVAGRAFDKIKAAVLASAPGLTDDISAYPQWWYPIEEYQRALRNGRPVATALDTAGKEALAEAITEYTVRPMWLAQNYPNVYSAIEEGIHTLPKEYWFKNMLGYEYPPVWKSSDLVEKILADTSTGAFDSMDDALDAFRKFKDANTRVTLEAQKTDAKWQARIDEMRAAKHAGGNITNEQIAAVYDEWKLVKRPEYYEQWLQTQRETAEALEALVNDRIVVEAGYLPGLNRASYFTMTDDELIDLRHASRREAAELEGKQRELEDSILGSDRAKTYREALDRANDPNLPDSVRSEAVRVQLEIEGSLTQTEFDKLFGKTSLGSHIDEDLIGAILNARHELSYASAQELGSTLVRQALKVDATKPFTQMTDEEKVALSVMKYAMDRATEFGFSTKEVTDAMVAALYNRYKDPDDAAFMVSALFEKMQSPGVFDIGQGAVEVFPHQFVEDLLSSGRILQDAEVEKWSQWKAFWDPIHAGRKYTDDEYQAINKKLDDLIKDAKLRSDAATHDALTQINRWFMDHGVTNLDGVPISEMSLSDMWWRVAQEVDRIPGDARRAIEPALDDLNSWYDEVVGNRIHVFEESPVETADHAILVSYGETMSKEAYDLVSESQDAAVKAVNDLLFDYETTQNWMELAGKIFPFVRYPSKNIPLWLNKFAEVPHLSGSVVHARQIQQAYNADLPPRLRNTVKIPSALVDPLLGVLGFDNMELRINPWSYFSFMQQFPGATAFSQQRMSELGLTDETDERVVQSARIFSVISEELGFGMWPWLDWALGAQGLLGKDWYPKTAFSTWTPTVNWAMRELTDYGTSFDIDRYMRAHLPEVWNYMFGNTSFSWTQVNPDLFQEWAMGREIEGVLWKLPDPALVALSSVNPVQARGLVRGMDEAKLNTLRDAVIPILDMPPEEQAIAIPKLTPEEAAVFMVEVEKLSLRIATRKAALGNIMGNSVGLYANVTDPAEVEARQQRMQRRIEQSRIAPGAERREYMSQWYEEHPAYQLIQTWRFSEHPWAESAVGREVELWDATVNSYKDMYYDYSRDWKAQREAAIEEAYRQYPGDQARIRRINADFKAQKEAYVARLNSELNAEVTRRMAAYIETYPADKVGQRTLREGWETDVYLPVKFTPSEQSQLDSFMRQYPHDEKGYADLFERLYGVAQTRTGIAEKRHVNGLNDGLKLDLQFSPVGNANYSEEEVRDFLIGDVLNDLSTNKPQYGDYEDYDAYDKARMEFFDDLPSRALETGTAQKQVQQLITEQHMTQAQAEEVVRGWYTADELLSNWRNNDTVWEALDYVYDQYYISLAQREFFDKIYPLKETDYDQYAFLNADLTLRYPSVEAQDLVHYIMEDYPGRWTLAELDRELEGVVLPSYQDRRALDGTGTEAVSNHIWAYYNMLDADQRLEVRTTFGPLFQDQFMQEGGGGISIEKLGSWMDALATMVGDDLRWQELPNVDQSIIDSSKAEAVDYGLPMVSPRDEEEYKYAEQLNRLYWELKADGDERAEAVANDPIYDKWFGAASPKSYFWYLYYKYVPPGKPGREVRGNTIVNMVLDKETRDIVASNSDYDRASQFIEDWVESQGISVEDVGILSGEYDRVRPLIEAYTAIPREDTEAREKFINDNPLLKDYLGAPGAMPRGTGGAGTGGEEVATEEETESGGGEGGGSYYYSRGYSGAGGSRVDYKSVWSAFSSRVGQSLEAALRILSLYWSGSELPSESLTYLRKLHAELGGSISFESWLEALKLGYASLGRSGSSTYVSKPKAPPTPRYANVTRGIRR